MLNRAYVKFGKKNKILTLVKEVYLRTDIYCGSEICQKCYTAQAVKASLAEGHALSQRLAAPSKGSKKAVDYLVIDTNIVLHQMDLLNKPTLQNIIVLQTVLSEVKNQSPQLYADLRELCADPEKHFYVFSNEFHKYVPRKDEFFVGAPFQAHFLGLSATFAHPIPFKTDANLRFVPNSI